MTLGTDQVTLTWTPSSNTATSTLYNVNVSGFRDTEENLVTPFTSSFTTGTSGTPVTGTFGITSSSPVDGATGQANNVQIVLTFARVVDPTTVNDIRVYEYNTGYGFVDIAGTWAVDSVNGAKATFTPAQPYPANMTIQWYTQCQVRDFAGNSDSCNSGTFTVGNTTDNTAPTVTSVTPVNGATGIGRNQVVVLTFSKSLNPSTVNGNTTQLFAGDTPVGFSLTLSSDNRTAMLTGSLPPATTITVVATPFVTDLSGNALVAFQSNFTTAADFTTASPRVVTQRPANGATGVSPNAEITLFTSGQPLVPGTITSNSVLVSHNGVLINGTINIPGDGHTIEFVPSQAFNYGDIVQVFLANTILDVDGNFLTAYTGGFTIVANPGTTGPNVVATNPSPEYAATNVPVNIVPQIEFDQPLLASTVNSTNVTLLFNANPATPVSGTVSLIGTNTIQFQPSSAFPPNTANFFLNLNNVTNTAGKPLAQGNGYYSYFATGTANITTHPTVVAVSPVNGATGIGINGLVFVKFSKPIDPITVTGTTVQMTGGSQTVIPVTIAFDTTFDTATITPQAPFPPNTVMTVTINGVTDPEGNAVTPLTSSFTSGNGPDTDSPTVVQFSPQPGSLSVPTNTAITVQYSEPMNTATIFDNPLTTGTFLYDTVTGLHVPGTLSFSTDLTTATFVPSAPLLVNRGYYFYSYDALDLEGNLQVDAIAYFTTAFAPSATIPAVVNTNPENNVTGVATNTVSEVLFNEPIKPESISQVQLLQGGIPVSVNATLSASGLLVSLTPNALLLPNTPFTISVSGVQDYAGHTQSGTYTSTFTTGPTIDLVHGTVTSTDPLYGETGVGTNIAPTFNLSKKVNPITIDSGNAYIQDQNTGRTIPSTASVSADRMTVTITPNAALQPNTYYIAYLGYGHSFYDIAGNYFNASYTYFVTAATADTTRPVVTQISPPNGATGTPVNTVVRVVVNDPLDPDTVNNNSITVTPNGSSTPFPGTVTLAADQVTLSWTPSSNTATSTLYNVNVSGFRDTEENLVTATSQRERAVLL